MAPHSSTLAWKIPWTEEPGRLQSMGSRRVGHDWAIALSLFAFMHWRRKWQPTPVFLPGESQGQGAWWAAVYGVAQSRTRLKRLSSSSVLRESKANLYKMLVTQSYPTLFNPMDYRPPGSSAHGILQARILEWAAISSFRESSLPSYWTQVSCIAGRFSTIWATREAQFM